MVWLNIIQKKFYSATTLFMIYKYKLMKVMSQINTRKASAST